ncbi:trigger factor [Mycoplasmoides fastidiosum]|uniref:Trigger factor n=1 Tax=Mycoplasmoides fastidiosum TaxID=92758 RepID=A0ABU0LYA4_9BACT|nr:trigger factor [Mycoplasmoides fastidiosum]MDQ0513669.1 trigger factor [Mycoplasmoides fastidiosum]UUD37912.1 trigger factor [Mycoplasmoides fastidiosum]
MKILNFTTDKNTTFVTVETEPEIFEEVGKKQMRILASEVKIPGFRKGKVPLEMAEASVNRKVWLEKTLNKVSVAASNWLETNEDARLEEIIGEPISYEITNLDAKTNVATVKIGFESLPTVTMGDYSKIPTDLADVQLTKVTDADVDAEIQKELNAHTMLSSTDAASTANDVVVFDFEGSLNGKLIPNAKAENYELDLANSNFIPGFAEELVGLKKEEEKTFTVKFPEQYHAEELKGQDVQFAIKVHDVKTKTVPELNDQFVSQFPYLTDKTVSGYRSLINKKLSKELRERKNKALKDAVVRWLIANPEHDLSYFPQRTVQKEFQTFFQESVDMLNETFKALGGYKQYIKMINISEEQLKQNIFYDTVNALRLYAFTYAVAKKENITVEDADLESAKEELAKQNPRFASAIEDKTALKKLALQQKVIQFLTKNVVYEEPKPEDQKNKKTAAVKTAK